MTVKSPPTPGFSVVFLSWGERWFGGAWGLKPLGGRVLEAGPQDRERVKLQPCTQRLACKRKLWAHLSPPEPSDLLLPFMHQPPIPLQAGPLVKPEWQENSFSATLQQFPAHLSSALQLSTAPLPVEGPGTTLLFWDLGWGLGLRVVTQLPGSTPDVSINMLTHLP